jgi:hypothetical protein
VFKFLTIEEALSNYCTSSQLRLYNNYSVRKRTKNVESKYLVNYFFRLFTIFDLIGDIEASLEPWGEVKEALDQQLCSLDSLCKKICKSRPKRFGERKTEKKRKQTFRWTISVAEGILIFAWSNSLCEKTRKYVRKNRETYQ